MADCISVVTERKSQVNLEFNPIYWVCDICKYSNKSSYLYETATCKDCGKKYKLESTVVDKFGEEIIITTASPL